MAWVAVVAGGVCVAAIGTTIADALVHAIYGHVARHRRYGLGDRCQHIIQHVVHVCANFGRDLETLAPARVALEERRN